MARATTQKTQAERTKQNRKDTKIAFAIGRSLQSGVSAGATIGSAQGSGGISVPTVSYLPTAGGTMMGAIAFYPDSVYILGDSIDISQQAENFSSYIYVTGEGSVADNLDTIVGATHAGQILILQAILTTPITLKDTLTGNIDLPGGTDVVIPSAGTATLIFDPTVAEGGNRWVLLAVGSSGSGSGLPDKIFEDNSYVEVVDFGAVGSIQFVTDAISQGNITDAFGWSLDNDLRLNGNSLYLDVDGDSRLNLATDDIVILELGGVTKFTFSTLGLSIENGFIDVDEILTPSTPSINSLRIYAKDVTGVTKLAILDSAGTETILGSGGGGNEFADNVFRIYDNLDSTSKLQFDLDGMTTGVTSTIFCQDTSPRLYQLPNATTVLAGWAAANFFSVIQTFNADAIFNENVTLGGSSADNITVNGDFVSPLIPNATNTYDLGQVGKAWRDLHLVGIANLSVIASSSLSVQGTTTFTGPIVNINAANIFIGDSTTDNLFITAQVQSAIIPDVNNSFDLGSSSLRWNDIFLGGAINHASTGTIGFYGKTPVTRQAVTYAQGTDTLLQLIGRYNVLVAALSEDGSGVGLVQAT